MKTIDLQNLIGQIKKYKPKKSNKIYFKVRILKVKRHFGYILAKISPINDDNINNSSWIKLDSLENNIENDEIQ